MKNEFCIGWNRPRGSQAEYRTHFLFLISPPMSDTNLGNLRHSLSHILMDALQRLYPGSIPGVGPAIDDGFYHDFESPHVVTDEDLKVIEAEMRKIIAENLEMVGKSMSIDEAIQFIDSLGYKYTKELAEDLKKEGHADLTFWGHGNFINMCRGGHMHRTGEIRADAFKLHKVAGAYWRGDEKRPMLQRIYGYAFATKEELEAHMARVEDAKRRDHRLLGKQLDLFTFSDLVGRGLPMWTHYGAAIRRELEEFVIAEEIKRGYLHVITPELAKVDLYRKSGHYPYYKETMYPPMKIDEDELILRPMTCPHHYMLYADKQRSYRELPMRIAELARLYRYEKSGELTGMIRARSFCLADSHIVCREEQAKDVVKEALDLIEFIARTLGMDKGKDFTYRLSLGDRNNTEKYYKNDEWWDRSEKLLRETLQELNAPFYEALDEAAFYGPKIDIQMKNVLGKEDTAFTVQYDFCMPTRFELKYVDEEGKEQQPIVIHRSSIGAIERVFGFLIEFYAGAFPVWLSPVQVKIISVGSSHWEYCSQLSKELIEEGIRVEVDNSNETVGNKIRKASNMKVPYILVVGDREMQGGKLHVRLRGVEEIREMEKQEFVEYVEEKKKSRSLDV